MICYIIDRKVNFGARIKKYAGVYCNYNWIDLMKKNEKLDERTIEAIIEYSKY